MKSQNSRLMKSTQSTLLKFLIAFSSTLTIAAKPASIVVAGGCFWCMEPPFDKLTGVTATTSGYSGGSELDPSYKLVSSGKTRHIEVVKIDYDDERIDLSKILDTFWRNVNPTDDGGQFVDRGYQYSTAIFYSSEDEKRTIEKSKSDNQKYFKEKIVTKILKFDKFFAAEDYHQDYYKVNPVRYKYYRYNSGRDQYLEKQWDKK